MSRTAKQAKQRALLMRRYTEEHAKSTIHVAGVRAEIRTTIEYAQQVGFTPHGYLTDWLPTALRLTMARQKGMAAVLERIDTPSARQLIGHTRIRDNPKAAHIDPRLVAVSGAAEQGTHELFIEVGATILTDLDDLATLIRKTIHAMEESE